MVRGAIESLYSGRCTIIGKQEVFDSVTKRTSFSDVTICADEPCRLSFSAVSSAKPSDVISGVVQVVKLFIKPELVILAGSKITVTQNGKTTSYVSSGEPAIHSNHQEIVLSIEGDKA